MSIEYSIIIPTSTNLEGIKRTLNSILDYTNDEYLKKTELLLIMNGCNTEMLNYISNFSNAYKDKIQIINKVYDSLLGFSHAVNLGLLSCRGNKIIILHDDIELIKQEKSHWIKELEKPFSDEKVGITSVTKFISQFTNKEYVPFFCTMLSKNVLSSVGLFDETVFTYGYGEDCDLCARVINAGFKIVNIFDESKSNSFVNHYSNSTLSKLEGNTLQNVNNIKLINRYLINDYKLNLSLGNYDEVYININPDIKKKGDIRWNYMEIPLADNSCNGIVSFNLIEKFHKKDAFKLFTEWNRILKSDAVLTIHTFNYCKFSSKGKEFIEELFGVDEEGISRNCYCWDYQELKSVLEKTGFTDVSYDKDDNNIILTCKKIDTKIQERNIKEEQFKNLINELKLNTKKSNIVDVGFNSSVYYVADNFKKYYIIHKVPDSSLMENILSTRKNVEYICLENTKAIFRFDDNSLDCVCLHDMYDKEILKVSVDEWSRKVKNNGFIIVYNYFKDDIPFDDYISLDNNNYYAIKVCKNDKNEK